MKLQVTQENLSKALGIVARVANARNPLPILSNVLLRTVGNRLSIVATNLDIGITEFIGAKVTSEGAITVPARLMQDFISSLPGGVITLELQDNKLHITTDQYNSTINGVSAEDFPVMPALTDGQQFTIPSKQLKKGLQQVIIAASGDEARPVLTGVFFHMFENNLYIVATDSYRLAEKRLLATEQNIQLLIPSSALHDLMRIMQDNDDPVMVSYDEQQVLFTVGETELVTRLIDGSYPDYRKLIPASFNTVAKLKRDDFINITKVSSLFARESAGSITIHLDAIKKEMSITSVASQLGENTSTAEAEVTADGDITLNSRYVLEALNAFGAAGISFSFNGKLEPCVLKSDDEADYVHVVMPLRS